MRHRKGFNHLSRKTGHRRAMMANMAASLIKNKRITTTTAKAKALRSYVEPLITKSKDDTTHSRRVVFSYIQDKDAVTELFREISPKVMERPGGYTRIIKLDNRAGDNAEMALIELVDFNENLLADAAEKSTTSRRRRRGGSSKKKAEETQPSKAEAEVAEPTDTAPETVEEVKNQEEAIVQEEAVEEAQAEKEPTVAEDEDKEEKKEAAKEEKPEEKQEPKAEAEEEKPAEEDKKEENKEDKKES
jgi:large subunit ribosomal protein L17